MLPACFHGKAGRRLERTCDRSDPQRTGPFWHPDPRQTARLLGKEGKLNLIAKQVAQSAHTAADAPLAFFLPSAAGGGAENIFIRLATAVAARGYRVELVFAKAAGECLARIPPDIRIIDLGASRPLTALPALVRYLRTARPRVLAATITNANLVALWAIGLSGVPVRCLVREASTLSIELKHTSSRNRFLLPHLIKHTFRHAEAIVTPSYGAADDLACVSGLPREKINVIYNPVISPTLRERSCQAAGHRWLDDPAVPVVVGMGRLTRQKDFVTLIWAFARLRESRPARLVILGEGEERGALLALADALGIASDIDLPGFVNNPYAYLSRASLFVLSSRWEGLPGVLIEALACGTRVISTDCPSGPREILAEGTYGELVPVADPASLAEAMQRALTGKFTAADPATQLTFFDTQNAVDRYLALLIGQPGD